MRTGIAPDPEKSVTGYGQRKESLKELPRGTGPVLREIFLRGDIARGEVHRIIGASPRTGPKLVGELLGQRLVISDPPKGRLRLLVPAEAAGYYFLDLYPARGKRKDEVLLGTGHRL